MIYQVQNRQMGRWVVVAEKANGAEARDYAQVYTTTFPFSARTPRNADSVRIVSITKTVYLPESE
jgi:hypothetical protein